ncbi:MAG: hypothetical protein AABY07_02275 [Nanoarchaeota archaeon]
MKIQIFLLFLLMIGFVSAQSAPGVGFSQYSISYPSDVCSSSGSIERMGSVGQAVHYQ